MIKPLTQHQMALPRVSCLRRMLNLVSDVALALVLIAAISAVTIWVYETRYPRVRIDVTQAVVKKACGVPI